MDRSSFEASRRERAKQREAGGHPTPGDLAAYHAGRLTEERSGQIKDHLVACEDCTLLYDSLIEFEQYRPEPDASGVDPSDAAWLRMRERLREEERAEAPASAPVQEEPRTAPVVPLQRRRVPVWQRPAVAWAVAAGLMVCVVGLGIRNAIPPEPPTERREPGARQVIYLSPDETVNRGVEGGEAPEPPDPTVEEVVYEMSLPEPLPDATYRAEIFALQRDSEPIWGIERKDSDEYLTIGVPRDFLSRGEYRFRVHRIEEDGSKTLAGTYSFNVP